MAEAVTPTFRASMPSTIREIPLSGLEGSRNRDKAVTKSIFRIGKVSSSPCSTEMAFRLLAMSEVNGLEFPETEISSLIGSKSQPDDEPGHGPVSNLYFLVYHDEPWNSRLQTIPARAQGDKLEAAVVGGFADLLPGGPAKHDPCPRDGTVGGIHQFSLDTGRCSARFEHGLGLRQCRSRPEPRLPCGASVLEWTDPTDWIPASAGMTKRSWSREAPALIHSSPAETTRTASYGQARL